MRILITFARAYPLPSALMLFALLLAGIVEGAGLSALLPLLGTVVGQQHGLEQTPATGAANSVPGAEYGVNQILGFLGLEPSAGILLLLIVLSIALKSGLVLLAKKRVGYTVANVATDLRLEFLRALLVTRWEYYLRQPVGSLANAVATEAMRAADAYLCGATMAAYSIQVIVYMGVAFLVSWKATLASLTAGLIILVILSRLIRKARHAGERQTKLLQSLLARLTDSLQSIKPLKAMAREELADTVLQMETNRLNKALRKQVFSKEALGALQEPMITAFLAMGLYAAMVLFGLSLATVAVLVFLLARLMSQLGKVQRQYQKMTISESAYWSLQHKIKEAKQERERVPGSRIPSLNQTIQFDGVRFGYGPTIILRDISVTIYARSFTVFVGPSGAGKTTAVDLITGLLRPQQGEILIDKIPMAQIDLRSWRQMIGYVPQETLLLHDTVFVNVCLGDQGINEEDVKYALQAAGAWDFVNAMPKGIHSTVGERGGKISGGQRQRIAIARALVHRPKLLILDEATSALDSESEMAIARTLQKLRGKLTIIAISHQPALVKAADRAYHLQDGRAVLSSDSSEHGKFEPGSGYLIQTAPGYGKATS
jgi:ATP-binding cassette subfamily C protein